MFKNLKLIICILVFAMVSSAASIYAENWPNFHNGNTLIKNGKFRVVDGDIAFDQDLAVTGDLSITGDSTFSGDHAFGTDTLTTDAADPGTATATLAEFSTYVISDATGTGQDVVTLIDGTKVGMQKRFVLKTDAETSGTVISPTNYTGTGGAGTGTLFITAGESVTYEWDGANWFKVAGFGTEQ